MGSQHANDDILFMQVVHKLIVCVLELCRGQLLGKETQEDVDDEITGHPIVVRECGNARIGEEESMQVTVDMPVETVSVEELDGQAVSEDLPTHVTRRCEQVIVWLCRLCHFLSTVEI